MKVDLDHRSPSIVTQCKTDNVSLVDVSDLESLTVDELWKYRESVDAVLALKITDELADLQNRLDLLNRATSGPSGKPSKAVGHKRRPYRSVLPKFRNPKEPSETWAGRGRQPRWVQMQLSLGKRLEDFRIEA